MQQNVPWKGWLSQYPHILHIITIDAGSCWIIPRVQGREGPISQNLSSVPNNRFCYKLVKSLLLIGYQQICHWFLSFVIDKRLCETAPRSSIIPQCNLLDCDACVTFYPVQGIISKTNYFLFVIYFRTHLYWMLLYLMWHRVSKKQCCHGYHQLSLFLSLLSISSLWNTMTEDSSVYLNCTRLNW